jgi:hypothetical protein
VHTLPESAFDHFIDVYIAVRKTFETIRSSTGQKFHSPAASIRGHSYLILLLTFFSWFFVSQPLVVMITEDFRIIVNVFGFMLWVVLIALIIRPIYRYAINNPFLLLLCNVLLLPALPLLPLLLSAIITNNFTNAIVYYLAWSALSLITWLMLFGMSIMIGGNIPLIALLLFSSTKNNQHEKDLIPGYIDIVRQAASNIQSDDRFKKLDINDWRHIEHIARWKFDGMNGRLQAFSFGIGGLAFLSIFALIFSPEEVRQMQEQFWQMIGQFLGIVPEEDGQTGILLLIVFGIVFLAIRYFYRSYAELRYLEAIGIICGLVQQSQPADGPVSEPPPVTSSPPANTDDEDTSTDAVEVVSHPASIHDQTTE